MEKLVKKDYNNELETKLEQKTFEENVQSNLLSILYILFLNLLIFYSCS